MIGKQLLNYKIVSLIGEGGMGNVYLGEHTSIGRKVAIKVLRPELASNEEIRSRFKNEASVMARLQHPGIVSLFDYVENDDGLFLIMEYVEGIEITDLLKALDEPLSIDRAKDIMKKVLSAFSFAHKNKIVHRDVKPSNILITSDHEVKVLDFGIAKLVGDSQFNLTKTGTQVGTVFYMSPEQVKAKELDQRSDIYSLGITFYELLAGFCPYKGTTSEYEVYDKIVREPLLPLTETLGEQYAQVWGVIKKATEKGVDDRFQNCDEFIAALDKEVLKPVDEKKTVQAEKEVKAAPKRAQNQTPAPVTAPKKKSKAALFVILGIVVIVSIVAMIMASNGDQTDYKANNTEINNNSDVSNDEVYLEGRFPEASQRILSPDDIRNLSNHELGIMRNEIFARYGYIFSSNKWSNYFSNQVWYSPKYVNIDSVLTNIEHENISLIKEYEY